MKYKEMNYKDINNEYLNKRTELWQAVGTVCIYCGKDAEELHHIIPRHMGGDNRISNIVPLCRECHFKAHSKRASSSEYKLGRKELPLPSNFEEIADYYLDGVYKLTTALKCTGMKRNTFYRHLHKFAEQNGRENQLKERKHHQKGL